MDWRGWRKHRAAQKLSDLGTGPKSSSPSSTGAVAAIRMDFRRYKGCTADRAPGVGFAVIK